MIALGGLGGVRSQRGVGLGGIGWLFHFDDFRFFFLSKTKK